MSSEVVDVAPESLDGHAEVLPSESGLEDGISEDLIASEEGLELVGVGVLIHSYAGGDEVLGFEGRVCDHGEDVDHIMGEAGGAVVGIFSVVVHFELSTRHLRDAVVDCLAGVDGSLQVCILQGEQGA